MTEVLILGGGLAGLSTAYHLGSTSHLVLEAEGEVGGLCRTRIVDGFHFDYTGHLLHLRDPRALALVESLLPDAFRVIERRAFIRTRGVTLPFPFQANLKGLPPEVVAECILGAARASSAQPPQDQGLSFRDWSLATLGKGISDAFMFPYNTKLFRRVPEAMTADWVSWAVPRPNLEEVVRGALGLSNPTMGYNATFRYPVTGGIRLLPEAFAGRLRELRLGARVTAVDLDRKDVVLDTGERLTWERLAVTLPLPGFLRMLRGGTEEWGSLAWRLDWSVVCCLNLGIDRAGIGGGAHWLYFPDPEVPFYRVGFPTNMSDGVAPHGTSSLYVEFGLRRDEPIEAERLESEALAALRREGILRPSDRVIVRDCVRIDPGYVIFDRGRQEVLARVVPALEEHGVLLLGRYGAWTYSYMERAILDGLEAASVLSGAVP